MRKKELKTPAMHPASSELVPGVPVSLSTSVRRLLAPNAGMMTGPGTNTYLIGVEEIAVLDPGPADSVHLQAILSACPNIHWVIVTHTHRDHSPLAAALARETGACLIGLPPPHDGRQDDAFMPHRLPFDGERMQLGRMTLTAIHTPGHASNCVCYLLESERLLFTGDHVLEGVSPVILPPDGDMFDYLGSLQKLRALDFESIAPGHGRVMGHGKRVVEALRLHRLTREEKAWRSLAALGASTLERLTPAVYDDVPADRHVWARLTLEAHLIKLAREGRAMEHEGVWRAKQA